MHQTGASATSNECGCRGEREPGDAVLASFLDAAAVLPLLGSVNPSAAIAPIVATLVPSGPQVHTAPFVPPPRA